MDALEQFGIWPLIFAGMFFLLGGFIKGAIGFALPLVAVTGTASVLPAKTAVACIILPILIANLIQATRDGLGPLMETLRRFWLLNIVLSAMIGVGALMLTQVTDQALFLTMGVFIGAAAALQLAGWTPEISARWEQPVGVGAGALGGFIGGLSGIWGPPPILYYSALNLPKLEHVRAAGVTFLAGSIIMLPAHLATGVLDRTTMLISLAFIPPALIGMAWGRIAQKQMNAALFRKATLIVLLLASANLLRRAYFG